jgi:hypothetical protein
MASELIGLSPFENAALVVQLKRLRGPAMLQIMCKVEPGWSDSTYHRRLNDALISLENKGLVTRMVGKGGGMEWHINIETAKLLSKKQLLEACLYLGSNVDTLEAQSFDSSIKLNDLQRQFEAEQMRVSTIKQELEMLKKEQQDSLENQLTAKFPGLSLGRTWVEAFLLLALVELMARHKLAVLDQDKPKDLSFSELFFMLKKVLPEKEGRSFDFHKEILDVLYQFRNKMIHNGLGANVRKNEADAISALVTDIYQQLFGNATNH